MTKDEMETIVTAVSDLDAFIDEKWRGDEGIAGISKALYALLPDSYPIPEWVEEGVE
jgi:hypothetical protein